MKYPLFVKPIDKVFDEVLKFLKKWQWINVWSIKNTDRFYSKTAKKKKKKLKIFWNVNSILCFSFSWLREFIDDPYRGHVALVEFLQYLHLNQPTPETEDVPKKKGKPDVMARDFVSTLLLINHNYFLE